MKIDLFQADVFEKLNDIPDDSIDLVLTDFPYGISFMSKDWDSVDQNFFYKTGCALLPKMKAGSFLVTTFTPRQDMLWRCLAGLEKAGFSLKTSPIFWLYHSGFPKAMDVSKAMDKRNGKDGKIIGDLPNHRLSSASFELGFQGGKGDGKLREPESDEAKQWFGWKSFSLKPSVEVIIVVQKPLATKTIVEQVLLNGHGAVNVEETRIPYANENDKSGMVWEGLRGFGNSKNDYGDGLAPPYFEGNNQGRFPANLLVEGEPLKGETVSVGHDSRMKLVGFGSFGGGTSEKQDNLDRYFFDGGSPNRFYSLDAWAEKHNITLTDDSAFLDVPKPSNSEKEMEVDDSDVYNGKFPQSKQDKDFLTKHPTVKPFTLFSYLLKMFGKRDWVVLDPFMGSGTTGIACHKMGMNFVGIEKNADYFKIAEARLKPYMEQKTVFG